MKNLYKALIGVATAGTVATAGIATANILSENKEETVAVAEVNEMKNETNLDKNKIEENIVENGIESSTTENSSKESNTQNITQANTQQEEQKVETQPESVNNESVNSAETEVQNSIEKTGTIKIDINSICGKDMGRVRIRILMKDGIVNDFLASGVANAKVEGTGIENVGVNIMTGATTIDLTGTINFDDENPMCVFE